jgi:CRP-like cAMP-binding protein
MSQTPSVPECSPDLLRTLFLFESLSDERLDYLCQHGSILEVDRGWLYRQGEGASSFYVLLEGTIVMSRKVGDDEV